MYSNVPKELSRAFIVLCMNIKYIDKEDLATHLIKILIEEKYNE